MTNRTVFDGDGDTFKVYSDNDVVLQTPLEVLADAPPLLVGQNPATLLPAYCPAPDPVIAASSKLQDLLKTTASGSDQCIQIRCGAAEGLTGNLQSWFNWFRGIISAALTTLGVAFGTLLVTSISAFIDALTGGVAIALTPEEAALLALIVKGLPAVTGGALSSFIPQLGDSQLEFLRQTAFCSIGCSGNALVAVDTTQMKAWQAKIATSTVFSDDVQRDCCAAIALWGSDFGLLGFVQAAQTGATIKSDTCDSYVCP